MNFAMFQRRIPGASTAPSEEVRRLKFQDVIESQLEKIIAQFSLLSTQDGKVVGEIRTSQLEEEIQQLEKFLDQLAKALGVADLQEGQSEEQLASIPAFVDSKKSQSPAAVVENFNDDDFEVLKLSPATTRIAVKCLESLQELAYELKTYAMILNAVNLKQHLRVQELSEKTQAQQQKIQKIVEQVKSKKSF